MRRCLIGRKVACTLSNEMAERLLSEASTRDLPNWPKCLYLKGLINISLLLLVLLQAYPAINRASDVNNVAFVYFIVDHDNVRPVMRHFPIFLNGKRILALSFASTLSGACSNHFLSLLNPFWRDRSQCLCNSVVSSFISCLRDLRAITHDEIDRFVLLVARATEWVPLWLIDLNFSGIGSQCLALGSHQQPSSSHLSSLLFLST